MSLFVNLVLLRTTYVILLEKLLCPCCDEPIGNQKLRLGFRLLPQKSMMQGEGYYIAKHIHHPQLRLSKKRRQIMTVCQEAKFGSKLDFGTIKISIIRYVI